MKRRVWLLVLIFIAAFSAKAQNDTVIFSSKGGFYEETFALQLYHINQQYHIRYTTNGNRPTAQSPLYADSLWLDETKYSESNIYTIQISPDDLVFVPDSVKHCIVIRAAVFDENDSCVSQVMTQSYFIKALGCDTHGLPTVSICADSLDLFDYESGIFVPGAYFDTLDPDWSGNYYQSGMEWERPMNIEFYELDNTGINQQAGIRTHGGNGRRFQQKCVKIYAREEYGKKRFKHKFFETIPINNFKHLVLKPFAASWNQSGVNDHICNQIASQLNLESLASRPVVLYLNGEYWGIYYIHERPDERYLEDHYGVDIDHVNIMANWVDVADHGTAANFIDLFRWVEEADLTTPEDYAYFESHVDIDNFIDYQIFEMFIENCDWPANNMRCWQEDNGPWRWIFYDGDACLLWMTFYAFDNAVYDGDSIWPSSAGSTLFFRKLLENEDFQSRFISRFQELLNTSFSNEVTSPIFEEIKLRIEPEVPLQSERFGFPESMEEWASDMAKVDYFLSARPNFVLEPLNDLLIGIPENQSVESIMCFPNPFSDEIHLRLLSDDNKVGEIAIYDVLGRKVLSEAFSTETGNEITLNPSLPAGVYVLKVGSRSRRIVRY